MALSTYSDLQAAAAQWLHRTDLAGVIPGAIALAEARMGRDLRVLSLEGTAAIATAAGTGGYAVPADAVGLVRAWVLAGGRQLPLRGCSAAQLDTGASGRPQVYAFEGGQLLLGPVPDAVYSVGLVYRRAVPALSASAPTNDILARFPDAYLFATLVELGAFADDKDAAALWEQRYQQAARQANRTDNFKSQGLLRTDLPGAGGPRFDIRTG